MRVDKCESERERERGREMSGGEDRDGRGDDKDET